MEKKLHNPRLINKDQGPKVFRKVYTDYLKQASDQKEQSQAFTRVDLSMKEQEIDAAFNSMMEIQSQITKGYKNYLETANTKK